MPELPEVETVRRGLERLFAENNIIEKVELQRPDLRVPIPRDLPESVRQQPVTAIRRRAKYLLFDTPKVTLISHLGMSGSWRLAPEGEEELHDHIYITLAGGPRLAFNDPRRFGILDMVSREEWQKNRWLKHLGAEPFEKSFNAEAMFELARGRSVAIKSFLMDQKIVVGVGNIYASEALYVAGIKPIRPARRVTLPEWRGLIKAVRKILQAAIDRGGTTFRDYRNVSGGEGDNQVHLRVYDRAGGRCRKCKDKIRSRVIGGRSTYWCNGCQR